MKLGVKMLFLGVLIGIVLSLVGFSIIKEVTKKVIIYEAKTDMLVGGMRIPKGFKFFKVTSMPEGFDVIKVEICVFRGYLDKLFVVRKYIKGEILDYWVMKISN